MKRKSLAKAATFFLVLGQLSLSNLCAAHKAKKGGGGGGASSAVVKYDIWAVDQSNTAPGQTSLGVKGSYLWIWDGNEVERVVENQKLRAIPLPCTPNARRGPCDILTMFPPDLVASDANSTRLADLPGFGRLHVAMIDPYNRYAALSMFVPGGGYIGIVDTKTKEAVALFRATRFQFKVAGVDTYGRSTHMNFWTKVRLATVGSCMPPQNIARRLRSPCLYRTDRPSLYQIWRAGQWRGSTWFEAKRGKF
jgi:hypothetical protein